MSNIVLLEVGVELVKARLLKSPVEKIQAEGVNYDEWR